MSEYTIEKREADAEIAVAMGWRRVQLHIKEQFATVPPDWEETEKNKLWFLGRSVNELVPYFHSDYEASAVLLEWVKTQEWVCRSSDGGIYVDDLLDLRLATPAEVAEAVHRMIKELEL